MNDEEFWILKLLELKYRRRDEIIQTFYRIGSPQKFGPLSLICWNLKFSWVIKNALKSNEGQKIWVLEYFKTEIQKGDQIIQNFRRIGFLKKLGPPTLICRTFMPLRKVFVNHAACIQIWWIAKTLGQQNF